MISQRKTVSMSIIEHFLCIKVLQLCFVVLACKIDTADLEQHS